MEINGASLHSISSTFVASLRSIGTAVTMALTGFYLHRTGNIGAEGKRTLAILSQQITIPLFLFSKIIYCNQDWSDEPCPDVTKSLADIWMLLFWPIYVVGLGLLIGWIVAKGTNTPKHHVRSVLAACAFGNSSGLPITLLNVIHSNFPKSSDLGRIDPTLFLSVFLLLYPVLQWGLGGFLLTPEKNKTAMVNGALHAVSLNGTREEKHDSLDTDGFNTEHTALIGDNSNDESRASQTKNKLISSLRADNTNSSDLLTVASNHNHNNSPTNTSPSKLRLSSADESLYLSEVDLQRLLNDDKRIEQIDSESVNLPHRNQNSQQVLVESTALLNGEKSTDRTSMLYRIKFIAARCFQPPVVGAIAGIVCASFPRLRGLFVDLADRDSDAPLQFLFDGLYAIGTTAVPINMMILGCNLSSSLSTTNSTTSSMLSMRTMIGIVIGKMILSPIIGIGSSIFLKQFVLDIPDDIEGAFYLVLMIVFLTPTANNVMVMVELSGSGAKEGMARVIALQYLFAPIILSITMTIAIGVASGWS